MFEKEVNDYLFKILNKIKHQNDKGANEKYVLFNLKLNKYFLEEEYVQYITKTLFENFPNIKKEPLLEIQHYYYFIEPFFIQIELNDLDEILEDFYEEFVINCYGKRKKLKNNINSNSIKYIQIENKKIQIKDLEIKKNKILSFLKKELLKKDFVEFDKYHDLSRFLANVLLSIKTFTEEDLNREFEDFLFENMEVDYAHGNIKIFNEKYSLSKILKSNGNEFNKQHQKWFKNWLN